MRFAILPLLLLAACSDDEAEPTAEDARKMVEASQRIPSQELVLEPIAFADVETAGAFGFSCAFATAGDPDDIVALAMRDMGFLKSGGTMQRFAADKGSGETVAGSWTNYDGAANTFTLTLDGKGAPGGPETTRYPARLIVEDSEGGVVYDAEGSAVCGV